MCVTSYSHHFYIFKVVSRLTFSNQNISCPNYFVCLFFYKKKFDSKISYAQEFGVLFSIFYLFAFRQENKQYCFSLFELNYTTLSQEADQLITLPSSHLSSLLSSSLYSTLSSSLHFSSLHPVAFRFFQFNLSLASSLFTYFSSVTTSPIH